MTGLLVKAVLSYLLGSLVGSLLIARLTGGADIRTMGSGNAGATNALRTLGRKVALVVLIIDLAKGWIATGWLAFLNLPGLAAADAWREWSIPVCGLAVLSGHVYPVFFGFRGGKGVATLVGAVLGISPWLLIPMILTWLVAVILFGFVSLGSMLAAIAVAIAIGTSRLSPHVPLTTFGILSVLLIVFTHRANLKRLREGTESRARRLWLFGTRRGAV